MDVRLRFWRSARWPRVLLPDGGLAEAEGLAAGTGLLTGDVVRTSSRHSVACPACGGPADVVVIDLVARETSRRCPACLHRWTTQETVGSGRPRT